MKFSALNNRTLGRLGLACCLFAPLFSAQAAESLSLGSAGISAAFIEDYEATFDLVTLDTDGTASPDGYWTDIVTHVERDDRQLLRREVARFTRDGQRDLWRVHLADSESLAPMLTHDRTGTGMESVLHIDYQGTSVTATVLQSPEAPALTVSRDLEEAPFDLSLWAPLLMSVPRETGYVAEIPVIGKGLVLASETITVHGEEVVDHPSGKSIGTWKISTTSRPWTLWVMDKAPYIVKIVKNLDDGKQSESWLRME